MQRSIHRGLGALMLAGVSAVSVAQTPPGDAADATLTETAKSNALGHIKLITDIQAQIYAVLTRKQQAKIPAIAAADAAKRDAASLKLRDVHEAPRPN